MKYSVKVPGATALAKRVYVTSPFQPDTVIGTLECIGESGVDIALQNAHQLYSDKSIKDCSKS